MNERELNLPIVEAGTILTMFGSYVGAKLFGPTLEHYGHQLAELAAKRKENFDRVVENAGTKLGDDLEEFGIVPPRMLNELYQNASFEENVLSVEYYGGLLASSRTPDGKDDRAVILAKKVASLTVFQIRAHYIIYRSIHELFVSKVDNYPTHVDYNKQHVYIPVVAFMEMASMDTNSTSETQSLLDHMLFALSESNLIGDDFVYGPKDQLKEIGIEVPVDSVVFTPTMLGIELFLNAFGHGNKPISYFYDAEFSPSMTNDEIYIPSKCGTYERK